MHILILSKRNAAAQARMLRAAEALANRLELDPALVEGLKPKSKDSAVRALKEREGVAALLEELAYSAGALERPEQTLPAEPDEGEREEAVTTVTDPESSDQPAEVSFPLPADLLSEPDAASTGLVVIHDDPFAPDGGLPAPTLEEAEAEPPATKAEDEPVAEAVPIVEEEPSAPDKTKKPRVKRSKK